MVKNEKPEANTGAVRNAFERGTFFPLDGADSAIVRTTETRRLERKNLPAVNGYTAHQVVTLDGKWTYEQPIAYVVKKTAHGGWWGCATYADGQTLKAFRKEPLRIIPLP